MEAIEIVGEIKIIRDLRNTLRWFNEKKLDMKENYKKSRQIRRCYHRMSDQIILIEDIIKIRISNRVARKNQKNIIYLNNGNKRYRF